VASVAAALDLALPALPVVNAFSDLLFKVVDRKDEPGYLLRAVEFALTRPVNPDDERLLCTGLNGTVQDVMELPRRQGRPTLNRTTR